jgi:hypothetical protein
MGRLWLFAGCLVMAVAYALGTVDRLPETVATHFAKTEVPDVWVQRDHYRITLVLMLTLIPLLLVWLMARLPSLIEGRSMIPNSEYWFHPNRRQETEAFLLVHAIRLGVLVLASIVGLHVMILRANAKTPPALNVDQVVTMIVIFMIGLAWWLMTLLRRFDEVGDR